MTAKQSENTIDLIKQAVKEVMEELEVVTKREMF
jgi:hypothetical protein